MQYLVGWFLVQNHYYLVIKHCQLLGAKKEIFGVEKELFGAKIRSFSTNSKFILSVINLYCFAQSVSDTNWSNEFHDKYFFLFKISSFYYFIFLISEPGQLIDLQNMVVWENICSFFRPAPASSLQNKNKTIWSLQYHYLVL